MDKANEIFNWVQNAVGDMAYDQVGMWEGHGRTKGMEPELDKLVEDGVIDIGGCHADNLYDDKWLLVDLIGDRLYDATQGDNDKRNTLVEELRTMRRKSTVWDEVCNELIR